MTSRFPVLLGLLSFFVNSLPAQNAKAATQDSRITLNVVVNDKAGKPVAGLHQQDFTLLDNKTQKDLLSFQAVTGPGTDANAPEVILVQDAVNTAFSRVAYERIQLQKFLRRDEGKLALPTSICFFSDSGITTPTPASRDGNALVAAIDQNANGLRTINRSQGFYGAEDRIQLSLRAVGELARFEGAKPGRKIVIWISPGWALLSGPAIQLTSRNQQEIFNTVVALSTQLRQSNITLYSIDPLGTADSGGFRTFAYESYLKGVKTPGDVAMGDLALQVLAAQSGGRVLNSNNDLVSEIETSLHDLSSYYVLSFAASTADGPNEYHALQIKLSPPDLKAQFRTGYYAEPNATRTN